MSESNSIKKRLWNFQPIGETSNMEKASFYDAISDDVEESGFLSFGEDTSYYENPSLRVAILEPDGSIVSATGYKNRPTIKSTHINVYLQKYFVHSMPGRKFKLQFAVGARHLFAGREGAEEIGHTLAVQGIRGDFVSYLGEPVFKRLSIGESFSFDIAVNFVGDTKSDTLLGFLQDTNVTRGIELVNSFNPIFGSVLNYVKGISNSLLESRKNVNITNQHITFRSNVSDPISIPLVEANYLLIQPKRDEVDIDYSGLKYDSHLGKVLLNNEPLGRNYFLLKIEGTRQNP